MSEEDTDLPENEQSDEDEGASAGPATLGPVQEEGSAGHNLEMLLDLPLELSVELGRTRMSLQEMLKLDKGSVIRLGRTEGEPLDIQVNGRTVARGEVVVVNDRLGVRVTEIGEARERVAALAGCEPRQVTFTSGATEANNSVLKGRALRAGSRGAILVGAGEHPSVREVARYLGERGYRTAEIPVDGDGRVTPVALKEALERHAPVALVSVMTANNETGALQPIPELTTVCDEYGVPLHTDAVQAAGRRPLDMAASGVAALSLSAHKLYGPQGVGALVRDPERLAVEPLLHGGGHERERRAGTENVPGIVGFGVAAERARAQCVAEAGRLEALQQRLEAALGESGLHADIVAAGTERLPNTTCLLIPGVEAETLLMNLDLEGIAVSSGSACASGSLAPSPVLLAMGIPAERARSALRVSLGRPTTEAEVDHFVERLTTVAGRLQERGVSA